MSDPTAIQILHNFKEVAALAQKFIDEKNEGVRFLIWRSSHYFAALQDELGIPAGWINALSYEGLLNGVSLHQCQFNAATGAVTIGGHITTAPAFGWTGGHAPAYYQAVNTKGKTGVEVVAEELRKATASKYLRGLGLTDTAIAQAMK